MNRQRTLLFILLVLLLAAAIYAYFRFPRQQSVKTLKYTQGKPAAVHTEGSNQPETRLHLDLLDQPLPRFSGYKRNIFSLSPPEIKKKLPPPPPPLTKLPPPPPPPPPPSPAEMRRENARAEMAKFTFLGFLKKQNKKLVFLSKDNETFIVQQGELIAKEYEVTNITDEVLTLRPVSGGEELVIPLQANRPLQTPGRR